MIRIVRMVRIVIGQPFGSGMSLFFRSRRMSRLIYSLKLIPALNDLIFASRKVLGASEKVLERCFFAASIVALMLGINSHNIGNE